MELRSAAPHLPQVLEQFYKEALYAGLVTNLNLLTDNHGASAILELDYGAAGRSRAFTSRYLVPIFALTPTAVG